MAVFDRCLLLTLLSQIIVIDLYRFYINIVKCFGGILNFYYCTILLIIVLYLLNKVRKEQSHFICYKTFVDGRCREKSV